MVTGDSFLMPPSLPEEDSEEDSEEEDSEEEDSDDEDEDMETAELAAALREAQAAKSTYSIVTL